MEWKINNIELKVCSFQIKHEQLGVGTNLEMIKDIFTWNANLMHYLCIYKMQPAVSHVFRLALNKTTQDCSSNNTGLGTQGHRAIKNSV